MSFEPIPDQWRQQYLRRPLEKLPADLTRACDQIRAQRREIDELRGQIEWAKNKLKWAKWKNAVLMAALGGAAAKGIEVSLAHLLRIFGH